MIAKGTYGWVYKPEIKCKGSDVRGDGVSKLMNKDDAESEIKEQLIVDKIDPHFKYHLKTPTICPVGEYDFDNDKNLDECSLIPGDKDFNPSWRETFVVMQMEDGGVSLYDYMHKVTHSGNKKTLHNAKKFILGMSNLFEGLCDFDDNEFVHFDIKTQNIVYNELTNRHNFIDFGLSTNRDKILEDFGFMITAGYYALPFDIFLTNFSNYRLLADADEEHLSDPDFKSYLIGIFNKTYKKSYMPTFDSRYISNGASLYKLMYEDDKNLRDIHKELKTHSHAKLKLFDDMHRKLDIFSMGVVLIELYVYFTGKKFNLHGIDDSENIFYKDLHAFILKLVDPIFTRRYSADEAYEHIMELVHKYGGEISNKEKVIEQPVEYHEIGESEHKSEYETEHKPVHKSAHSSKKVTHHVKGTHSKRKHKKYTRKTKAVSPHSKTSSKTPSKTIALSAKTTRKRKKKDGSVVLTVKNPLTGRWISKDGRLAKKLGLV